ncbi:MAG TPA: ADP-ribosylglycohydrolase family protein [Steroidobacteraceae bacterium]|jgi:ADP-ribosyl-[dinitrogen reductase] hydrolase
MSMASPASLPLRNSYWVLPGQLLAGEYPGGRSRDDTRERLKQLIAAGVECFIDLTHPHELERYDIDLPLGVEYLRKPIRDHGLPDKPEHMAEILDCIHDSIRSGRIVYVHCHAGIGRTGTVVGCFLVERGFEGENALDQLNRLFQQSDRSKSWDWVPETKEQSLFVKRWVARGAPVAPLAHTAATATGTATATVRAGAPGAPTLRATAPTAPGAPTVRAATSSAPAARATAAASPGAPAARATAAASPGAPTVRAAAAPGALPESDPLLDEATLSAARGLRGRFHGALLGLATGDALAAATQYRKPGTFSAVGDLLGGGPFDLPRGAWSDDTAMALCLAESLIECQGFDAKDQVERFRLWQRDGYLSSTGQCLGITASTARALAMAQWRRQAFSGSHDPNQLDPEPLSRVAAPTMFFFAAAADAAQAAGESSRTTCQAPPVVDACKALGQMLHAALSGQPKEAVLAFAPAVPSLGAATLTPVNTAPEVLAAAIWAFACTDNFRDAVLRAVNLGGNSDVVAAVCGQLAGAYYSVTAIPSSWRNSLMQKEMLETFADRLLAHALLGLAGMEPG